MRDEGEEEEKEEGRQRNGRGGEACILSGGGREMERDRVGGLEGKNTIGHEYFSSRSQSMKGKILQITVPTMKEKGMC